MDPKGGERSVDRRHTRKRALCTWCCGRGQHVGLNGSNVVVLVVVVVVVAFATAAAAAAVAKIVVLARIEAQDEKRTDAAMLRNAGRMTGFVHEPVSGSQRVAIVQQSNAKTIVADRIRPANQLFSLTIWTLKTEKNTHGVGCPKWATASSILNKPESTARDFIGDGKHRG